jgi:hypothetical protein
MIKLSTLLSTQSRKANAPPDRALLHERTLRSVSFTRTRGLAQAAAIMRLSVNIPAKRLVGDRLSSRREV